MNAYSVTDKRGCEFSIYPPNESRDRYTVSVSYPGHVAEFALYEPEELEKLVEAIYAVQNLEIIPLRDELDSFLNWYNTEYSSEDSNDAVINQYLEFLKSEEAYE